MVTHCEVMEKAAKLSLQLEAYSIPDGFEATGKYWQVVARIRDEYTNYKKLLEVLQDCPADGKLTRTGRSGHDCAREMLDTEARELARRVFDAWSARRNKLSLHERAEKLA
ncbi:MAG: hypothetical protein ACM30E_03995 [Nitrososphaerales archaeon]